MIPNTLTPAGYLALYEHAADEYASERTDEAWKKCVTAYERYEENKTLSREAHSAMSRLLGAWNGLPEKRTDLIYCAEALVKAVPHSEIEAQRIAFAAYNIAEAIDSAAHWRYTDCGSWVNEHNEWWSRYHLLVAAQYFASAFYLGLHGPEIPPAPTPLPTGADGAGEHARGTGVHSSSTGPRHCHPVDSP